MGDSASRLIVLSGLSGSGKTTAARALEDEQFFVVDNLPAIFLKDFFDLQVKKGSDSKVAVVVDVRNRDYLEAFPAMLDGIRSEGHRAEVFFFDASDEVLFRRFSETRRRHPLIQTGGIPGAINRERELLAAIRTSATRIFDTSGLTVHELRRKVMECVRQQGILHIPMSVHLKSFGYRFGIPLETDMVLDVRFLQNPYFVDALRPLTGLDPAVRDYVVTLEGFSRFFDYLVPMLRFLLPEFEKENKSYCTISIGCTAGRHRSVAVVEELFRRLTAEGVIAEVIHRDLNRGLTR
ncbi:MAG: RNase adapter RapZ [Deltaproteobacteria bacterium]|nr:RNase adapter RapZ [Deltaproteobacteria bacterium]